MSFRRFIAICLLVLFSIGTVHAATMGLDLEAPAQPVATHCHEMGVAMDHAAQHLPNADKHHTGNICASCAACSPMLSVEVPVYLPLMVAAARNPHYEPSYASVVAKLPHRPPISA